MEKVGLKSFCLVNVHLRLKAKQHNHLYEARSIILLRNKLDCNEVHPYIAALPILAFALLRNMVGCIRSRYSRWQSRSKNSSDPVFFQFLRLVWQIEPGAVHRPVPHLAQCRHPRRAGADPQLPGGQRPPHLIHFRLRLPRDPRHHLHPPPLLRPIRATPRCSQRHHLRPDPCAYRHP